MRVIEFRDINSIQEQNVENERNIPNNIEKINESNDISDFEQILSLIGEKIDQNLVQGLKTIFQNEIKNLNMQHKIKIQELESSIRNLKQHQDTMEERNKQIFQDLTLQFKQQLNIEELKEKKATENNFQSIQQYEKNIIQFKLEIEIEKKNNVTLKNAIEEIKREYERTIIQLNSEILAQKQCIEKFNSSSNQSFIHIRKQFEEEKDQIISQQQVSNKKLEIDFQTSLEDFKDQINLKNSKILKLEKQIILESQNYKQKEQDFDSKIAQFERGVDDFKLKFQKQQEQIQQLEGIVVELERELSLIRQENELNLLLKRKSEEDNRKMSDQITKFEKYIYGDKKEKNITNQLRVTNRSSAQSSCSPSLNNISNSAKD